MKRCFLYPGQGAQFPGMGKDLFDESPEARELFEAATAAAGFCVILKISLARQTWSPMPLQPAMTRGCVLPAGPAWMCARWMRWLKRKARLYTFWNAALAADCAWTSARMRR